MIDNILNEQINERAVLVGLITEQQNEAKSREYLDELAFLADTAGAETVHTFMQRLPYPNPRTFVGKGKLEEIRAFIEDNDISMAIFDDDLSSKQVLNIERELKVKILDRTSLILDIFAKRARTANAKTQVELAQYQYLLPRLTRMWTHLERQRGGIGMRGPGETQIETDRRIILTKISLLKEELRNIDKQKAVQRKNRGKLTRVALVGYTNAGKSTLMNLLSKSDVFAENKLFATLDTTVRKVIIDNLPFLLTDTVGFIRKLPTHLVDSFKSTLDEVREADLLVHVVDISHPNFEEQIEVVDKTLREVCNGADKPMIMVFNKIDAFTYTPKDENDLTPQTRENISLDELKRMWMSRLPHDCVFISARTGANIDELKNMLYQRAKEIHLTRFPYNDFLFQKYDDEDQYPET
ncbi:GTPase HflX [Duncaniella muris]|uniref:GTPase HflX n=2 Tax=Duncaniella muris TaxID=2094150 RepID=A0A2V1IN18_9BACT|nr:GTPase HflX [Duncaniella muris]NBH91069.1 GTPase HflX [Muribaculaceae bacterium S4]NBI19339.1 GTPase HflX [Muribaculaceae bacterium Z1]ROS98809.1 GTPase HflX [Muribaculaceae bacterium Isolate-083 (Janvier)]ROS99619.1 GTPase HflX [Muribaculaceae bacterium Isolate-077 (Janvier)]ROT02321.1 GTPase HflX [Muribaculaceae bacterium Isolate-084 (Janvier)]GFI53298.1 GTPase HflX [Muribaculaceae bacterium]